MYQEDVLYWTKMFAICGGIAAVVITSFLAGIICSYNYQASQQDTGLTYAEVFGIENGWFIEFHFSNVSFRTSANTNELLLYPNDTSYFTHDLLSNSEIRWSANHELVFVYVRFRTSEDITLDYLNFTGAMLYNGTHSVSPEFTSFDQETFTLLAVFDLEKIQISDFHFLEQLEES